MSAAAAWALLGAALLLAGSDSVRPGGHPDEGLPGRPASAPRTRERPSDAVVAGAAALVAAACLAVGGVRSGAVAAAVCCPLSVVALRRAVRGSPPVDDDPALPLVLDLAAAALRSGRPVPDALLLAAPAAGPRTAAGLQTVARLLRLGAEPAQAWGAVPAGEPLAGLAPVAVRAAASGSKLAGAFERRAADLRAERTAAAAARAQRAGVVSLAPLAACFLPSFVCLGVVPVVVGMASTAFGLPP